MTSEGPVLLMNPRAIGKLLVRDIYVFFVVQEMRGGNFLKLPVCRIWDAPDKFFLNNQLMDG